MLVVEDEPAIADLHRLYLSREGFGVAVAGDGERALDLARSAHPVAIVLDVGLPGIDGIEVCRTLRASGDWTPVLFCTARDDEVDRVLGFDIGGDDYITKPFSPRELVARVKSAVRRAAGPAAGREPLRAGAVTLDRDRHQVTAAGTPVDLTATEFELLAHLMARPGRVCGRDELLGHVWGYADATTRTVDVHVAQLRAKLGALSPIRTVRGVGYVADP